MRFFLAKLGVAVTEKLKFSGDDFSVNAALASYQSSHPTLTVTEVTQDEYDATPLDATVIAAKQRADAVIQAAENSPNSKFIRGVFLVALDEINLLRQRDIDRSADVAASTSLADLKTRWAARSDLNERTIQQFKNAVQNKIDAGEAD